MSLLLQIFQIGTLIISVQRDVAKAAIIILISLAIIITFIMLFKTIVKVSRKIDLDQEARVKTLTVENNQRIEELAIINDIKFFVSNPKNQLKFKNSKFYDSWRSESLEFEFYFIELSKQYNTLNVNKLQVLIKSVLDEFNRNI